MTALALTIYILIWPAIALGVLLLIWVAAARDFRGSRSSGEDFV